MTTAAGSTDYDVVVIGAGLNGLTAATLLAGAGRKVIVLERRDVAGGLAAGSEFHPGYRSPGVLHDTTGLLSDAVDALGLSRHGLRREATPPSVFVPDTGNGGLLLHHDPEVAAGELKDGSTVDHDRYAAFRAFIHRVRPFGHRFLRDLPPDWMQEGLGDWRGMLMSGIALRRLGKADMTELLRIVPMSVADWLDEHFDSPLLKSALAMPALHGLFGGPRSPGTNGALLRRELMCGGAVVGGSQALVDALMAAAKAAGVEVRLSMVVSRIVVSGGVAAGVVCEDGTSISTSLVLSSCDPRRTLLDLVGGRALPPSLERGVRSYRMRGLSAKVNLALNRPLRFSCRPELEVQVARTGRSLTELERGFDPAKYGRFGDVPPLDIQVADGSESAPSGHAVVSVLVHGVPYALTGGWNDARREELGDAVIGSLGAFVTDLDSAIMAREVLTPVDIEDRYGVTSGHLYHGEHGLDQLLVRPSAQCGRYATPIEGLYLCGSGSHPGGGLTCAPGYIAARSILRNRRGRKSA